MSTLIFGLFGTTLLILISLVGHAVVSAKLPATLLKEHQGTCQSALGVVGTLFSVLIGFMVASSLETFHDSREHVLTEANSLGNIFRLAHALDTADRVRIRMLCREYCNTEIDEEWPLMQVRQTSPKAWTIYEQLWDAVVSVKPHNDQENNIQQAMLSAIYSFGESRRARIIDIQVGLSPALWFVIVLGALITIAMTFFLSLESPSLQRLIVILIAISLGLNIWLLAVFNSPFAGELRIHPDMFILDRDVIFRGNDDLPRYMSGQSASDIKPVQTAPVAP